MDYGWSEEMSAALERVIAEQQKEIDSLKRVIESNRKIMIGNVKTEQELYKLLDSIVDMRFKCATREDHDKVHKVIGEARMYMVEGGWCFNCAAYQHDCECQYNE